MDSKMFVQVDCYLCGSNKKSLLFQQSPFSLVKCKNCKLVYTSPRYIESKLFEIYNMNYWRSESAKDFGYTDYIADKECYLKTFREKRLKIIQEYKKGGKVLDVGCAGGYFL